MAAPDPRLAYAYRALTDTAIVVGAVCLLLALTLPALVDSNGWPLLATGAVAGLVASPPQSNAARDTSTTGRPALISRDALPPADVQRTALGIRRPCLGDRFAGLAATRRALRTLCRSMGCDFP